ncbi:UDP-glucose dehydrogenase family protein [Arthrobacter sp. H14]|uniref:UDP-glucose dehydrogenase family protein n=1 Tax=Arthrobacter sp. H14 TaxID=1312959 RepID=UPI00047AE5DA|nr:UDP-glucose/GDP-mannose dehydrogenase family protein [Arthrobacter sp. H14]
MKISVVGCGFLGAVYAAGMASLGHDVVGIDVDQDKLDRLTAGHSPFFEPGLDDLLIEAQNKGSLRFSADFPDTASSTMHFICVGTPQLDGSLAADVSYVNAAVQSLLPHLKPGDVVVGKSTVPVGTAARLAPMIVDAGADLIWNPEFLREGHAVKDTLNPDRLIYGVRDKEASAAAIQDLDEAYATMLDRGTVRLVMAYPTAELVKNSANSFLATKISFINAMAELCDASGADVTELADAIGIDDRIGRKFLNAGVGFGGGCLPKDVRALQAQARDLGVDSAVSLLNDIDHINQSQRSRLVALASRLCGGLEGKRLAVLGAAFKPNSDDVRDSPALDVAQQLQDAGAVVIVCDPHATTNASLRFPDLSYTDTLIDAVTDSDGMLLLTEWQEYRELDPAALRQLVHIPVMIDGRNVLDPTAWRTAGWTFGALGRP